MNAREMLLVMLAVSITLVTLISVFGAEPEGAGVTFVTNSTKNATPPTMRTDDKGMIITIEITTTQQNNNWRAYVGNITGTLTLDDSAGYTIFQWSLNSSDLEGEVYASRNDTVNWSSIQCANTTHISGEETLMNHSSTQTDGIASTFNVQNHRQFDAGDNTIGNNTCYSVFTYVNDTAQVANQANMFQEVLLSDGTNLVYTALSERDQIGYRADNATTFDFQMLVAENALAGSSSTPYYFYVEIGS